MPELPDVEGFRRELTRTLPGRRVRDVEVRDAAILRNTTARALKRHLNGHRFGKPIRHGKWLLLPTDGPTLLVHSGMTGHPYYAPADTDEEGLERGLGAKRLGRHGGCFLRAEEAGVGRQLR